MKKIINTIFACGLVATMGYTQHSSCADAIVITDGYSSGNITTSGTGTVLNSASSVCGEDSYFETSDFYVFEFTTGASASGYYVDAEITSNNSWQGAGLFSSCAGTTISGCLDVATLVSAGTMSLGVDCGLAASTTYYIVVSRWGTPDDLDFEIASFELKEFGSGTQANDECASATTIDLSTQYTGTTSACYTSSAQSHCWGSLDNDSWLEFTASNDTVEFDYSITNCTDVDNGVQFAMYSTCGGSAISGSCDGDVSGTGTYTVAGLTPGSTYLFRIDGWAGNICDYTLTPQVGVVVTPENDECADAVNLSCGGSATGSILLATTTGAPAGCGGLTAGKGIWYSFTGDGSSTTISTDNSGTNFDTELFIYEGPCASLSACQSDDDGGSGTTSEITFTPTNGQEYFVYVDGSGSSQGDVEISMTCAAAMCDCSSPTCPDEGLFATIDLTTPLPGVADANCYDPDPDLGVGTYTTCHTVTSSADGTLGVIQGMNGVCVTDIIATRSAELFAISAGSCTGSAIPADVDIANTAHSSTFNPEWYSLTPSTNYVICVTFSINSGCSLDYACLDYYNADEPSAGNPFSCSGSILSNDFESGTGADGGWTDYNNSTTDLNWVRGTDGTIDGTNLNGTDYIYIIDDVLTNDDDWEQHLSSGALDLSNYCGVDISLYYMYDDDAGGTSDKLRIGFWDGAGSAGTDYEYVNDFTTDQLTWTQYNVQYDLSTSTNITGAEWSNVHFEIGYQDNAASGNWAAVDNICISPIESIANLSLHTDGTCSGNDATFTVSFDVVGGSGNYEVYNSATSTVYGTIAGGATDGTIDISGTLTGPTTAGTISVDVRETGSNCSATDAPITINIPVCGSVCATIQSDNFNAGTQLSWTQGGGGWDIGDHTSIPNSLDGTDHAYVEDDSPSTNGGANSNVTMVSPAVDLSTYTSAEISFDYLFREWDAADDDYFEVEVWDGSAWQSVLFLGGSADTDQITWTSTTIDVIAYVNSAFQVRFTYSDASAGAQYWGAFDNFNLCGAAAAPCNADAGTWN